MYIPIPYLVALSGDTLTYIVEVDREDVLLLCDPMDCSVTLSTIMWTVLGGNTFTNPINVFNERGELPVQSTEINCLFGIVSVTYSQINVKGIPDQIQNINNTRIWKYLFYWNK